MNYYFHIDGQNVGPVQEDQIRDMITTNKINGDTLAWKEGMDQWAQAKDIPDLVSIFPELAGPKPTVAPIQEEPRVESQEYGAHQATSQLEYADFMPRFLAGLIDAAILFIPSMIINMFIPVLGGFLISVPYYLYFMSDYGRGQTIGYKAMKLRLIGEETNQPVPIAPVVLWYLVLSFAGFIGWIWFFTDKKRRMLHNIASKTVVVNAY